MSLESQIQTDLKAAMLARDEAALRALRSVKSAILLAKTSGEGNLSSEEELKMLQRLVKQRKESIEIYEKEGRNDLAKSEKEEVAVIEKFLPAQMSEDEVKIEVKKIIQSTGAKSAGDMGKVMGIASKQLAGKADNKMVATIVKMLLSQ